MADAQGSARRRLPPAAGHRPRAAGPRRRGGAASTWAPAAATSRWPWPRWSAATGGSTPSTATPAPGTWWPRRPPRYSQVLAITQAGEDLLLPEPVDLAFCRFLLLHVVDPLAVLARMAGAVRPGGLGGGPGADHLGRTDRRRRRCRCPTPVTPTSGPCCRRSSAQAGLEIVDAWAEAPAGAGPGPVADYLALPHRGRPRRRPRGAAAPGHRGRARHETRPARAPGRGPHRARARPRGGRRRASTWPTRSWPGPPRPLAGGRRHRRQPGGRLRPGPRRGRRRPPPGPPSATAPTATVEAAHGLRLRGRRAGRPGGAKLVGPRGRLGGRRRLAGPGGRPSWPPTATPASWPPLRRRGRPRHLDDDFELVRETFHRFAEEQGPPPRRARPPHQRRHPRGDHRRAGRDGRRSACRSPRSTAASPPAARATTWAWWWPPRSCRWGSLGDRRLAHHPARDPDPGPGARAAPRSRSRRGCPRLAIGRGAWPRWP